MIALHLPPLKFLYRPPSLPTQAGGFLCYNLVMKDPKCPVCGGRHYKIQCWKAPKTTPRSKMPLKPSKTLSNKPLGSKRYPVSSRKKTSDSERRKLIKELDKYWSWYVRLEESDPSGYITCTTCGKKLPYQLADNCHWVSRRYQGTRWLRENMHAGCTVCNRYKNGNYEAYNSKMKSLYGTDGCQKIWDKAYQTRKIPTSELDEMLSQIKSDYKKLISLRKKKGWKC